MQLSIDLVVLVELNTNKWCVFSIMDIIVLVIAKATIGFIYDEIENHPFLLK